MASVVRNIFMERGILLPRMYNMASEKAMSVAMGMPQPPAVSPVFKARYIAAGNSMPDIAAPTGSMVLRMSASSPHTHSTYMHTSTCSHTHRERH